MPLRLRNGRAYVLRPIRPWDKPLLRWGFERASAESIHKRFLGPKPRLTRAELRYLTEVDGVDHVALVAVDAQRRDILLGVGRWIRDVKDPEQAEMAILVADEVQGLGLGTVIGLALADAARARGITRFTATMFSENRAAHALFARISAHLRTEQSGAYAEVVADLGPLGAGDAAARAGAARTAAAA